MGKEERGKRKLEFRG